MSRTDQIMTQNEALWLAAKHAVPAVGPAPMPKPGAGEVVVEVRAVAINPVDRLIPTVGEFIMPYLAFPLVLGSDVAGVVAAVGSGVTRFRVGDRVVGYAAGGDKTRNRASEGAFQRLTVLLEHMTAPIPNALSFEEAAVIPLGLCTAAAALFGDDQLALRTPGTGSAKQGQTVLIWGGSSSVGSNAIQLAVAAGYDVVTTASPANFDFVRRLGARAAFDYRDPAVRADLIAELRGRPLAGVVAIGSGSTGPCVDVAAASAGNRFVAVASPPVSFDAVPAQSGRLAALVPVIARMGLASASLALRARLKGVRTKFIWGSAPVGNELGPMLFERFLPVGLANDQFKPAPPPQVVGHGLEAIPAAMERQRQGMSASKVVVTL